MNCIALSTPLIDFTTRENVSVSVSIMLAVSPSDSPVVESVRAFIASLMSDQSWRSRAIIGKT